MTLPSYETMLSELIAIPSASATDINFDQSNMDVIHKLAEWCEQLGMEVEIMPIPDEYNTSPDKSKKKANLIATLGKGKGGLVLSGHTDTVPCNARHWKTDPYQLTRKENKLHGLGATDMKGFFPVVLKAIEALPQAQRDQISSPIILLATADEESGMSGARALVKAQKPEATYAIIGEPTGLKPIVSHKGILMESIQLVGSSGHSSNPELGINAIDGMHWILNKLHIWRAELQEKHQDSRYKIPYPTLNLGCIHGGDNPNKICEACELHIDLRFLPSMSIPEIRTHLTQRLKPIEQAFPGMQLKIKPLFPGLPAFEQANGENALVIAAEELTQESSAHVLFGTEAPFLQALGMEPIVMGPGNIEQAHQPNEYIELDQIQPAIKIIESLIQRFCLGNSK